MVGEFPIDQLGNLAELDTGFAFKSADFSNQGVRLARGDNVKRGQFEWGEKAKFWPAVTPELARYQLTVGDVLIGMDGSRVGENWVRVSEDDLPSLLVQRVARLRAKPGNDQDFIWYLIANERFVRYIKGVATGTSIPHISGTQIRNFEVPAPPLNVQRQISAVLRSIDKKTALNRQMGATLEEMARALFQSWFVDFDPVHAKVAGRETGLSADVAALIPGGLDDGGVPIGWNRKPIIDLAHWINGAAYKNMHFVSENEGLPVVKIAELKAGITSQTKFTNTDLGDRYKISDRELLFSWSGNPETSIDTFLWMNGEAWLNQHIFAVRENGELSQSVLHAMLKFLKPIFTSLARDKQTTGLGHVTKEDMGRIFVALPTGELLSAFSVVFGALFDEYVEIISQNIALEAAKATLLPRLVSGELRVEEVAERIAAA